MSFEIWNTNWYLFWLIPVCHGGMSFRGNKKEAWNKAYQSLNWFGKTMVRTGLMKIKVKKND